jgi:hypothetical protein
MFTHSYLDGVLPVPPPVGALNVAYVLEKESFVYLKFPNAVIVGGRIEEKRIAYKAVIEVHSLLRKLPTVTLRSYPHFEHVEANSLQIDPAPGTHTYTLTSLPGI